MQFRLSILTAFLGVLLSPVVFSQSFFTISGTVHDASGARIPHAHIEVRPAAGAAPIEAESDDQGEFHIPVRRRGATPCWSRRMALRRRRLRQW